MKSDVRVLVQGRSYAGWTFCRRRSMIGEEMEWVWLWLSVKASLSKAAVAFRGRPAWMWLDFVAVQIT